MKKVITAVALLATFVASPAFARTVQHTQNPTSTYNQFYQDPDAVVIDGQVYGRDPDPNVRDQLRRDGPQELEGSTGG